MFPVDVPGTPFRRLLRFSARRPNLYGLETYVTRSLADDEEMMRRSDWLVDMGQGWEKSI